MRDAFWSALLVGTGGFVGSVLRFIVSNWVQRVSGSLLFPWGTLTVNVVGCFVIGAMAGMLEFRHPFSPDGRLFLLVGLLGGFTTFSAFGYEIMALTHDGDWLHALGHVGLHLVLALPAVWLGFLMVSVLTR
jgi:fluoride exporter